MSDGNGDAGVPRREFLFAAAAVSVGTAVGPARPPARRTSSGPGCPA